jgi:hypothetical protein
MQKGFSDIFDSALSKVTEETIFYFVTQLGARCIKLSKISLAISRIDAFLKP